jgi:peptide/nickel transport system permease protein
VIAVTTPTLFSLVLVFGLLSWEELARSIRAAVISEREADYVVAARNAGAGRFTIVRRHVLPNVSGTVLTGITNAVPKLVMIEALFAFLGLAGPKSYSWGRLIYRGLQFNKNQQDLPMGFGAPIFFESAYWVILSGAASIALTVLALTVFGDALQRAIDPTDGGD